MYITALSKVIALEAETGEILWTFDPKLDTKKRSYAYAPGRSWKRKGQEKAAHPHMKWGRQMVYVNHFYFYLWGSDWGGAFWKTNAYAPYPISLWLNGHEWAKRQLKKSCIGYEALDNGFRSCKDPAAYR